MLRRAFSAQEQINYTMEGVNIGPFTSEWMYSSVWVSSRCSMGTTVSWISMSYGRADNVERSCRRRRRRRRFLLTFFFLLPQNLFWNGKWIGKSNGRMYSAFNEHSLCTNEREFITVEMAERRRLHCSRWTFHSCRQWETHLRPAYSPLLRTKSSQTQTNIENGRSVRAQQAYFFGIACTCVMDGWRSEHKENP